jgi:spermidine synthase
LFQELDYCPTPIGPLSLRRRFDPVLKLEVFEVKLGEEFLMSSAYTVSERALAELALEGFEAGSCDVLVGGLGLGYTALAALESPATRTLLVAEYLEPVIEWHKGGVLPLGTRIADDPRTTFLSGDFFDMAERRRFGERAGAQAFGAILLDIDHTPDMLLSERSRSFYEEASLARFASMLQPEGVFALWSDDPPQESFVERLRNAFGDARAVPIRIERPQAGSPIVQTVYLARAAGIGDQHEPTNEEEAG